MLPLMTKNIHQTQEIREYDGDMIARGGQTHLSLSLHGLKCYLPKSLYQYHSTILCIPVALCSPVALDDLQLLIKHKRSEDMIFRGGGNSGLRDVCIGLCISMYEQRMA